MQLKPVLRYIYKQGCPLETIGREHGGSGMQPVLQLVYQPTYQLQKHIIFTVVNTMPESFFTGLS